MRFCFRLQHNWTIYLTIFSFLVSLASAGRLSAQYSAVTDFTELGRSVQRSSLFEFDGAIYFGVGRDFSNERELWRFDGQRQSLVADGFVGSTSTSVDNFTEFQGSLYFTADDGLRGTELYRFDGERVALAAEIQPGPGGSFPTGLTVYGDRLMFSAQKDGVFNTLWSFDGKELQGVATVGNSGMSLLTGGTFRDKFLFGADDGQHGMELWSFDGTNVSMVADINTGPLGSRPRRFFPTDDRVYFEAITANEGKEIWSYDGNQVQILGDLNRGAGWFEPLNMMEEEGALYFSGESEGRRRLWTYDGTKAKSLVLGGGPLLVDDQLFVLKGRHVGPIEYIQLWIPNSDGTTSFFREMAPSAGPFITLNNELYFSCECDTGELFRLARVGDANHDGTVDFADFLFLSAHFGQSGSWNSGDFDGNGRIDFGDFLLQANNFGVASAAATPVPEPSTAVGLGILVIGGILSRPRRA